MKICWNLRFAVLTTLLLLAACNSKEPLYQEQGYVFGTLVEVSVYGEDEVLSRQAVASVMREFQRLHELLHAWKPSALSELNSALAKGESKEVTPELAAMLKDATQLSIQSDHLFNPAIGGMVQLWGFHADEFKPALPNGKKLATLLATQPRMSDLVFNSNRVSSKNRAVQIDLGGYAKGYALDQAVALLKQQGVHNALINIGGNVLALGTHGTRAWRIGIQHPRQPGPIATMDLRDGEAVGTSGDYQHYFILADKRYCHLIDPRSGQPVQGVQAVTVLTRGERAGVLSDAVSKPLFVSGRAGWRAAARKMHLAEALLIDDEGTVHSTAALQKRLEFSDKKISQEIE